MKKAWILTLSLLTLMSLSNCSKKKDPSSSIDSSVTDSSSGTSSSSSYSVVGSETATSHTVVFYSNISGKKDIYALYYVEDGQKIKKFYLTETGYKSSLWYYDAFGTKPFDFDTPITGDLELYAYPMAYVYDTEINEYEETGDFDIRWVNSPNCSFVLSDSGTPPSKANAGDTISFTIAYSYFAISEATVTVDDQAIAPDESGVYTLSVTGNHTIVSSGVEVSETGTTSAYTLYVGGASYKMTYHAGDYGTEYMVTGVRMEKGDTFYVEDAGGVKFRKVENAGYEDGFVAPRSGSYDFYFKVDAQCTWVTIPEAVYSYTIADGNAVEMTSSRADVDLTSGQSLKIYMDGEKLLTTYTATKDGKYTILVNGETATVREYSDQPITYTYYLKPNSNWLGDNARFAAYLWGSTGDTWVDLSLVSGDIYALTLSEEQMLTYTSGIIFCRMDPTTASNGWDSKWNQTADLSLPTDGKNLYTVAPDTWDKGGGTWSVR